MNQKHCGENCECGEENNEQGGNATRGRFGGGVVGEFNQVDGGGLVGEAVAGVFIGGFVAVFRGFCGGFIVCGDVVVLRAGGHVHLKIFLSNELVILRPTELPTAPTMLPTRRSVSFLC